MRADDVYAILSKRIKEMQAPGGGELDWELLSKKLGTPVGEIISYMGTAAPEHYLICDGTEYNVEEYPKLAQHFIDNFGTANYFGGDGENTFAVPDLRGEFLRGSGTAERDTGSGAEVGAHQNPTTVANSWLDGKSKMNAFYTNSSITPRNSIENPDKRLIDSTHYFSVSGNGYSQNDAMAIATTRPTNTSVLYCIKCELA